MGDFVSICSPVLHQIYLDIDVSKKVQVGKDQEKAQSEKDSHSKNEMGKTILTIRYLYHDIVSRMDSYFPNR